MRLIFFRNACDSSFIEFQIGAFCDFDDDRGVFYAVNDTVKAGGGDDFITGFESGDTCGLFFALTLLRTDEQEVKKHDHDDHHDHRVTEDRLWTLWSVSGESVEELDHVSDGLAL